MKDRSGVTLLETVVAMGIIFLALLALSGLAVTSGKGMAASTRLTTAVTLAQDTLETAHAAFAASGVAGHVNTTEDDIPGLPSYTRTFRLEPNHPAPGLHTATVEVRWMDDRHALLFSTIFAR